MKFKISIVFAVASLFLVLQVKAQGIGNSPYSLYGFGDIYYTNGTTRNTGMGNTGVALRHHYYINNLNPAYYSNFRKVKLDSLVKLEGGFNLVYRNVESGSGKQSNLGGNIVYLSFALPMSKVWGMGLGVRPFSVTDNNIKNQSAVVGNPAASAEYTYKGEGSLTEVYMGHGVGLTKFLTVGMEGSFVFGSLYNTSLSRLILDPNLPTAENQYGFRTRTRYNGAVLKPGLAFRFELKNLRDTVVEQRLVSLRREHDFRQQWGIVKENEYEREVEDLADRIKKLPKDSMYTQRRGPLLALQQKYADSIVYIRSNTKQATDSLNREIHRLERLPFRPKLKEMKDSMMRADSSFGSRDFVRFRNEHFKFSRKIFVNAGATYNWYPTMQTTVDYEYIKVLASNNAEVIDSSLSSVGGTATFPPATKFGIGVDRPGKWAIGADVSYTWWSVYRSGTGVGGLHDTRTISIGGEITPPTRLAMHARTYRFGLQYAQMPLIIDGSRLNDFSFSFGASVPVGSRLSSGGSPVLPRINVALVVGQRGSLDGNLVRDRYAKLVLSILVNQPWFGKRKLY